MGGPAIGRLPWSPTALLAIGGVVAGILVGGPVAPLLVIGAAVPAFVVSVHAAPAIIRGAVAIALALVVASALGPGLDLRFSGGLLEIAAMVYALRLAVAGLDLRRLRRPGSALPVAYLTTPVLTLGSITLARMASGYPEPRPAALASRGFSISAPASPTSPLVLLSTAAAGVDLLRYVAVAVPLSVGLLLGWSWRESGWAGVRRALLAALLVVLTYPAAAGVLRVLPVSSAQAILLAALLVAVLRRPSTPVPVREEWALFGAAALIGGAAAGAGVPAALARLAAVSSLSWTVVVTAGLAVAALYLLGVHPILSAPILAAAVGTLGPVALPATVAIVGCGAITGALSRFSGQSYLSRVDRPAASQWREQGGFVLVSIGLTIAWSLLILVLT